MTDSTLAAVAVGERRFELSEFPLPHMDPADGLLRVEASGVCGSDLKKYLPASMAPTILGHETVGTIEQVGALAARHWGVEPGDRVLLEEYLPCGHCDYCRSGEFRSCLETDNTQAGALRYGSTPVAVEPSLWGGYSRHQYLHLNSVLHRVPNGVPAEQVTFAIPLSNGLQWTLLDGGLRSGDTVLIQGPGQQGIGCLMAAKSAGAGHVVVSGLSKDAARLSLATTLGADAVVDVESQDLVEAVSAQTGGRLVDVVVDVSGGGPVTLMQAIRATRKGGTIVLASGSRWDQGGLDLNLMRKKQIALLGVRGHSFAAVEKALALIAGRSVDLSEVCHPPFALAEVNAAFDAAAGKGDINTLHASVDPWLE
jgi:threonine dehydrogenase-like Zn-dependent dehydrogenase